MSAALTGTAYCSCGAVLIALDDGVCPACFAPNQIHALPAPKSARSMDDREATATTAARGGQRPAGGGPGACGATTHATPGRETGRGSNGAPEQLLIHYDHGAIRACSGDGYPCPGCGRDVRDTYVEGDALCCFCRDMDDPRLTGRIVEIRRRAQR